MTCPKILIVEDERIIARDIQNRLKKFGYKVTGVASSGEEAIYKASQVCPDLVLMDIRLEGDMDGVEAAKQIHTRFKVPIVYLTAYPNKLERAEVPEAGYLVKPFKVKELYTTIETVLAKHQSENSQEKYLNHPTFGLLYRLCILDNELELFTTLYAQRFFFLVAPGVNNKFEPISRTDAGLMVENRLRQLRRTARYQEHDSLKAMYCQTFY